MTKFFLRGANFFLASGKIILEGQKLFWHVGIFFGKVGAKIIFASGKIILGGAKIIWASGNFFYFLQLPGIPREKRHSIDI